MIKATSTVSGSGPNHAGLRSSIPHKIVLEAELKEGDTLLWTIYEDGSITVKKL